MEQDQVQEEPKLYVTPEYWGDRPGYSVIDSADYHLVKWFPVEELAEAQAFAEKGGAA